MPVNSTIEVTITHEKVAQIPDSLKVQNFFLDDLQESIWAGVEYPFIVYPVKDGNQIFYTNVSSLDLDSSVSADIVDFTELSSTNWDESLSACDEVTTGCFFGDFTIYMDPTPPKRVTDDCGCIIEIEVPRSELGYLTFNMDLAGTIIDTTVSSEFRPDEDPFPTTLNGGQYPLLDKMVRFDLEDYHGNGILFENENSTTSRILNRIFNDSFTNIIQERLSNFFLNTQDVDLAHISSLNIMGEMMGLETDTFILDSPFDIQDLITLGSFRWVDPFGFDDVYSKYNANNLGDEVLIETNVSSGERLMYQNLTEPEDGINVVVVPQKYDPVVTVYPLSSMELDFIEDIELYRFWRIEEDYEEIVANRLVTDLLSGIPDEELWEVLVERKIHKKLLDELVY